MRKFENELNKLGYSITVEQYENTALGQRFNRSLSNVEYGDCYIITKLVKNTLLDYNVFEDVIIKDGYFINKPKWVNNKLIEVLKPLLINKE